MAVAGGAAAGGSPPSARANPAVTAVSPTSDRKWRRMLTTVLGPGVSIPFPHWCRTTRRAKWRLDRAKPTDRGPWACAKRLRQFNHFDRFDRHHAALVVLLDGEVTLQVAALLVHE